ncbi:hypothetical protein caldi_23400 [Caldinitratiruptor microaerophilus]|uniref:HTH marR-type domain-containing protein n=2 Tax=Caldinitratiruptor microaerophilus TaxID=671077 RepID=A0AA35G8P6_9FIRM|nr:hypothetical protein caldi_23400 [Caldinitratiruptor microaerophilus]
MEQIIRLIGAIQRAQENQIDRFAQANWNLTSGQLRLILSLIPGRAHRTLELARRLYTDPGTVSGLLHRLTRKGLVTCRQSNRDRRVQLVSLTPAGERIRAEYQRRSRRELAPYRYAAMLSQEERHQLLDCLTRYAAHLMGEEEAQSFLQLVEEVTRFEGPESSENVEKIS